MFCRLDDLRKVEKVFLAQGETGVSDLKILTDFVVGEIVKKRSGMEARKSATLWSDEQHRGKEAFPIPWDEAYLRAVYE